MSMYVPEIKEEVSENAKMLVVEEDGKVYRAGMSKISEKESNAFIMTFDIDSYKVDKTGDEMLQAFLSGKTIYYKYIDTYYPINCVNFNEDGTFNGFSVRNDTNIFSDGTVYID